MSTLTSADRKDQLKAAAEQYKSYVASGREAPRSLRLAAMQYELLLRGERELQSDLGEKGRAGGLMQFVTYFWHVLEPNTPLVIDMPMEAICLHLEAVTRGEINRICINVSPGESKSLLVNVFHPAWEWSAAGMPWLRYVTFAYAAYLTERDNQRFRDIIRSPEFQELWGHAFKLTSDGQIKPSNDKTGWKFSSSMKGVGTGERGHRILCFPADQKVATELGPIPIGEIVEQRLAIRAWSLNPATNALELKPIVGWHRNLGRPLVRVTTESGASVTCTHDHRIYTAQGQVEASRLAIGDSLLAAPSWVGVPTANVRRAERQIQVRPDCAPPNASYGAGTDAKLCGQHLGRFIVAGRNLTHHLLGKVRYAILKPTVRLAIVDVLKACTVSQISQRAIEWIAVQVANLLPLRTRAYERFHQQTMDMAIEGAPFSAQANPWIASIHFGTHDAVWNADRVVDTVVRGAVGVISDASCSRDRSADAAHSTKAGHFVISEPNDRAPVFSRVSRVASCHDVPSETYCITVESNHNLLCGDGNNYTVCSNCDDLHNVKEGDSEAVRSETVRWAREGMSNRLNDMQEGVIILIGQRVHEEDVSNAMLTNDLGYVHLNIPMEYDPSRHCVTEWWEDPRTEHGELGSPIRFPPHIVSQIKRTLGPYAYSSQYMQSPEPRGGGILKRDWWEPYELAVGAPFRHSFDFIVASLDPAFTAKQENDPSGFTVWGVYTESGNPKAVLLHAWKKWLELHGQTMERLPNEDNRTYQRRASPHWGLVEWVAHDCTRLRVHRLLIEDKASGHSVAQEMRRLYSDREWGVQLYPVGNLDKRARAYAIQPLFADDMIQAPASVDGDLLVFRDWAQMVIDECAKFRGLPGDEDNLVDSSTQAIKFLRDSGMLLRSDERKAIEIKRATHRGGPRPSIYPV